MADHWTLINWTVRIKIRTAKAVSCMVGEFLRDGGILVIVFGVMDRLEGRAEHGLSEHWVAGCFAVGLGALLVGILFGLWGQNEEGG
jgi:hypothetical protein